MDEIKVSVVIPAYNAEKYIGETIESVYRQTLKDNVEILVIIDGGTDNTEQVVSKLKETAPANRSLVLIKNDRNLGVAETRNVGIENARGEYIAFLDSDDYWTEDKLEKQFALIDSINSDEVKIVFTARELIDENGISLNKVVTAPEKVYYKDILKDNRINCSSAMMRAEVAKSVKMDHPELAEDYLYWLRLLKAGGYAAGINEPLLKYRVQKSSKSGNKLKAAKMHMGCYRLIGISPVKSVYYFIGYAIAGYLKYKE